MSKTSYHIDNILDTIIDELSDLKKDNVDIPRLKELNNTLKTKILLHSKILSYNTLNKKGHKIPFFEPYKKNHDRQAV